MEIKIINHLENNDFLEYIISIRNQGSSYENSRISLRYSELIRLHKSLIKFKEFLPDFPKKFQSYGKSLEHIQQRKILIENYFNQILSGDHQKNSFRAVENFLREKVSGLSQVEEIPKNESVFQREIMKRRKSEILEINLNNLSIFSGKEYVIEGEPRKDDDDFRSYHDNIFDKPKPKKGITDNLKERKKKISFFESFFGCCNYQ